MDISSYLDGILSVVEYGFVAFLMFCAYNMGLGGLLSKSIRDDKKSNYYFIRTVLNGVFAAGFLALLVTTSMGGDTCVGSSDPLYGGCDYYDNGGYEISEELLTHKRQSALTAVFFGFFFPYLFGTLESRRESKLYEND